MVIVLLVTCDDGVVTGDPCTVEELGRIPTMV